jgi:hypothetical protein
MRCTQQLRGTAMRGTMHTWHCASPPALYLAGWWSGLTSGPVPGANPAASASSRGLSPSLTISWQEQPVQQFKHAGIRLQHAARYRTLRIPRQQGGFPSRLCAAVWTWLMGTDGCSRSSKYCKTAPCGPSCMQHGCVPCTQLVNTQTARW